MRWAGAGAAAAGAVGAVGGAARVRPRMCRATAPNATASGLQARVARRGGQGAALQAALGDVGGVERDFTPSLFAKLKQFRAIATRYDKLAVRYQATLHIAVIGEWIRPLTF